ncbi:MAG: hypothetical protein NC906_10030 [Candidatus Omnitrophica bacterium]|nr:hypothetical protein [Candidatus Omnitrophota bacterium]
MNTEKEWEFVIRETHKKRGSGKIRREVLFVLQILLSQIDSVKQDKEKDLLIEIYQRTKRYYLCS